MTSAAHKWKLRIGKTSSTKAGVFHESLCRFHTPLSLSTRHEELDSNKQPVLLPALKQAAQKLHKNHSLPHEIHYLSLLLIYLSPLKKEQKKK